jgi:hypothetical protein
MGMMHTIVLAANAAPRRHGGTTGFQAPNVTEFRSTAVVSLVTSMVSLIDGGFADIGGIAAEPKAWTRSRA